MNFKKALEVCKDQQYEWEELGRWKFIKNFWIAFIKNKICENCNGKGMTGYYEPEACPCCEGFGLQIDGIYSEPCWKYFTEDADNEGEYQIDIDGEVEVFEIDGSNVGISEHYEKKFHVAVSADLGPEEIVSLVENEIDNIKGESLSKIIELVVKKLNKLRTFLESIRGL